MRVSPTLVAGWIAGGFLLLALGVPLAAVALRGLADGPWQTLITVATDPYLQRTLARTALQAALSTLLTVALGLPAALAFARWSFPGKRLARAAFTVPFVMPSVVAGAGFLALIGPRGVLPWDLTDTLALVLAAHVFYNVAVVIRMVGGFLESAAPRLRDAAATLGASPLRTVRRVTLPLATPMIAASAALVFVFCFTSFGVIKIIAPGGGWDTLEVEIYRVLGRLVRLDLAAGLALVQLGVAMIAAGLYTRLQARTATPLVGATPLPRPGPVGRAVLIATLAPAALLTAAPLTALLVRAFAGSGAGASLDGFRAAFAPSALLGVVSGWDALANSLRFAAASGAVATIVGVAFAYAVVRGGQRWLDRASLLPLATSSVTLGLGVLLAWPAAAGSFWGLALAHALIGTPFVTRAVLPSLRCVPASRTAAAAVGG
ncbi:MAG: ABC transporter permease subunit, partial [Trueperaceae bacterium]